MPVSLPIVFIYNLIIQFLEEMKKSKTIYIIMQEFITADLVCIEV